MMGGSSRSRERFYTMAVSGTYFALANPETCSAGFARGSA
jgi:hypothetical protein